MMRRIRAIRWTAMWLALVGCATSSAQGYPMFDLSRPEVEAVLEDLVAWWPGEWSSYPQVQFERSVRMPAEGEHDNWYRSFARIDAPHLGTHVFYGQINVGGRDGPILPRSQVLYLATIDEGRQAVLVRGQPIANPQEFVDLHHRPELWGQVRQQNPNDIKCDFLWRRSGQQLVGVLDGATPERRKYGAGTCSYMTGAGDVEFVASSEWVLSPEQLWVYDVNMIGGRSFVGRKDFTHTRLYRASPYRCAITDASGERVVSMHDRGAIAQLQRGPEGSLRATLLRAAYPAADGFGLDEELRLTVVEISGGREVAIARQQPLAGGIQIDLPGASVKCQRALAFDARGSNG